MFNAVDLLPAGGGRAVVGVGGGDSWESKVVRPKKSKRTSFRVKTNNGSKHRRGRQGAAERARGLPR